MFYLKGENQTIELLLRLIDLLNDVGEHPQPRNVEKTRVHNPDKLEENSMFCIKIQDWICFLLIIARLTNVRRIK